MSQTLSFKIGAETSRGKLSTTGQSTGLSSGQVLFAYNQLTDLQKEIFPIYNSDTGYKPTYDARIYTDIKNPDGDDSIRIPVNAYFSDYSNIAKHLCRKLYICESVNSSQCTVVIPDASEIKFEDGLEISILFTVEVRASGVIYLQCKNSEGTNLTGALLAYDKNNYLNKYSISAGTILDLIYTKNNSNTTNIWLVKNIAASSTHTGTVNIYSQTFAGNKTFEGKTVFNPSPSILNYVFDGAAQEDALCIRNENTNSGTTTVSELYLDSAGIQSVSQGQASSLFLNCDGGSVYLGPNLFIDNNLIQSIEPYDEEEVKDLYINSNGGKIYTNQININPKETPTLSYTNATTEDFLTIGNLSTKHYMALDRKYIQAIYDNKPDIIYINPDGGDISLAGENVYIYENGIVELLNDTASSSATNGALVVSGGIGVAKTSYMSSILPKVTGDCALGGVNNIWADIYSGRYNITDSVNKYAGGMIYCTSSTSTSSQPTCVTLGNTTATGTAGSRYGELRLFSQGTKYSRIITEDNSSSNRTVTIPALDGNMTLSETTAANDGVEQRIAFYTTNYKRLGSTTGFTVIAQNGDNIDNGRVKLYLGNSTPSGTMGNQFGELTLYGTTDKAIVIAAEPGLSENQRIYLRKYWASANTDAYLVATLGTQAVGDTDEPVYINSNGVATKCSGVVVTTGAQTFTGNKTFASIYFSNNSYSHGSIVTSSSTSTTSQATTFTIGNNTNTGTAGSRYGIVKIYGTKSYAASLSYSTSATANTNHYLPPSGGTLMNGNYMVGVSGSTYGTVTQMNALSSPSTGQMFFVLV